MKYTQRPKTVNFRDLNRNFVFCQYSTLEECDKIYPDDHIKRRVGDERILGTLDQFCAAFYHVPEWEYRESEPVELRNYSCLDQKNCIIAKERKKLARPRKVVAVAKFENPSGKILYEARYTNCGKQQMHAENFFQRDIENGVFSELVQDNPEGTITLYLTTQPCNKPRETPATDRNQSCCNILRYIFIGTLRENGRKIDLCVKAAHQNYLGRVAQEFQILKDNAKEGIKHLITDGVKVSGMTQDDWDYLFTLTKDNQDRKHLDQEVESIFRKIEKNQE